MFLHVSLSLHQFSYLFVCGVWGVVNLQQLPNAAHLKGSVALFHLCIDQPSFKSIEKNCCCQCSQQTHSDFHICVLISPDGFQLCQWQCSNSISWLDLVLSVIVAPKYLNCLTISYSFPPIATAASTLVPILITTFFCTDLHAKPLCSLVESIS